jgi:histone-lysine N-methyltransferase MLL3
MLAQQLGRPLQPVNQHVQPPPVDAMAGQVQGQAPVHSQAPVNVNTLQQQMNASSLQETSLTSNLPSDHQELPDSVTAELEKLEQEQHNDHNQDAETSDLADLGMDDDEFLGMEDFNILEYADPELDEVVGGEKTNILDNLDLEEEVKEDKDKRKDAER